MVTGFELMTVGAMFACVVVIGIYMKRYREPLDRMDTPLWLVRARRTGAAGKTIRSFFMRKRCFSEITLGEKQYLAGNRLRDEIYIDTSGERTLLYLNVQKDCIYVTVLQGEINIGNSEFFANPKKRMELLNGKRLTVSDIELEFVRI